MASLTPGFGRSPAKHTRAPGESAAHRLENDQLTGLQAAIAGGFGQCKRYRSGRGIGVSVDGEDHLFHRNAELVGRARENSPIGLVRYDPVDVLGAKSVGCQRFFDDEGQIDHGVAKNLAPGHAEMTHGLGR